MPLEAETIAEVIRLRMELSDAKLGLVFDDLVSKYAETPQVGAPLAPRGPHHAPRRGQFRGRRVRLPVVFVSRRSSVVAVLLARTRSRECPPPLGGRARRS